MDTVQRKAEADRGSVPTRDVGLLTKLRRAVVGEVRLSDKEVDEFIWDFELALLEGDVAHDVAEAICSEMREKLAGRRFHRGENVAGVVERIVRDSVRDVLVSVPGFDFLERARSAKPCIIMFLGPNGAGKTTAIGKVTTLLRENGLSSILAAADTFRAASIEQLEEHARRLGVRVVKHKYGADPAAVAFDAVQAAKAGGIDCVLIDTAGRQETNKNLMEELKKINRVCSPTMRIYVDEALAGNVLVDRVRTFKEGVGVDGLILTKMDVDVKGGGTISVAKATGVPILFFGTGQGYSDLKPFDAEEVLSRLFG
ncbi:MAG: signal recognition particle-docking protein FtsY [Candidatus Diapherotrites archaeon]|nr:signal recognition particle-docking protein FtsY [Candidatus Diapherotrites archaeon]